MGAELRNTDALEDLVLLFLQDYLVWLPVFILVMLSVQYKWRSSNSSSRYITEKAMYVCSSSYTQCISLSLAAKGECRKCLLIANWQRVSF